MSALDDLAARFGIEADFTDAHGTPQHISAEVKRALLTALGAPVTDDPSAQRALDDLDRIEWLRPLPPVLVTSSAAQVAIPVTRDAGTEALRWRVSLEAGGGESGSALFADLRLLEERTIEGRQMERRELVLPVTLPPVPRVSVPALTFVVPV